MTVFCTIKLGDGYMKIIKFENDIPMIPTFENKVRTDGSILIGEGTSNSQEINLKFYFDLGNLSE